PKTEWPVPAERNFARALGWSAALAFLFANLLPGALPRYSLPAVIPACWLMAMTLSADRIRLHGKFSRPEFRYRLVIGTALAAAVLLSLYGFLVVPMLRQRSKVRPIAAQIDRLVPASETLFAVDPDFQPFLFYVKSRLVYVGRLDQVPATGRYLLLQPELEQEVMNSRRWAPLRARPIERLTDYR